MTPEEYYGRLWKHMSNEERLHAHMLNMARQASTNDHVRGGNEKRMADHKRELITKYCKPLKIKTMKRKSWTTEEEAKLIAHVKPAFERGYTKKELKMLLNKMAELLDRTRDSVRVRIHELRKRGLIPSDHVKYTKRPSPDVAEIPKPEVKVEGDAVVGAIYALIGTLTRVQKKMIVKRIIDSL